MKREAKKEEIEELKEKEKKQKAKLQNRTKEQRERIVERDGKKEKDDLKEVHQTSRTRKNKKIIVRDQSEIEVLGNNNDGRSKQQTQELLQLRGGLSCLNESFDIILLSTPRR